MYEADSPHLSPEVWTYIQDNNLPVLGICYGMQELAHHFGGKVEPSSQREFGRATVEINEENRFLADLLFLGVHQSQMWMSHGDKVVSLPPGFTKIAHTENSEYAAVAHIDGRIFGLQFHPEVTHSLQGKDILRNFVVTVCKAPQDWDMTTIADRFIAEVCGDCLSPLRCTLIGLRSISLG